MKVALGTNGLTHYKYVSKLSYFLPLSIVYLLSYIRLLTFIQRKTVFHCSPIIFEAKPAVDTNSLLIAKSYSIF